MPEPTQHSQIANLPSRLPPSLLALGAILLWGTLAALGVELAHVPPFLLTGLALGGAACWRCRCQVLSSSAGGCHLPRWLWVWAGCLVFTSCCSWPCAWRHQCRPT